MEAHVTAHPSWDSRRERLRVDTMTREGANALAARIRACWATIGHDVQPVVLHEPGFGTEGVFVVRLPTLCNGLPMRRAGE